jgi:2,3-bisphosphoglycerate-independent phosphoglycerate mutase
MAKSLPLVLMILDGWGYRKEKTHNAIASAKTPQWDNWWQTRPHMLLEASGSVVGLPEGQMGNSEVGHMHIGAGRIIPQDFTRINDAITQDHFKQNTVFINAIKDTKQRGQALHVLGLLSKGGVHSHENHLFAFLDLCKEQHFTTIYLHLFLDGRDTPPQSALSSLATLQNYLELNPVATISSISGRYYAMDRDKRWQRIEPVYRLLTQAVSEHTFDTATQAVNAFYQQKISDEFIPPTLIGKGMPIKDGDSVFFFNYRADRVRQLTEALIAPDFQSFKRDKVPHIAHFISMTHYADYLPTTSAFPPLVLRNTLGEVLDNHGLKQLRISETEKYAHVTFFLNGGSEQIFSRENRILIPSPLVATYDLQPEMSATKLTETLVQAIRARKYDVIVCNYPNADMVGHTGDFKAAVNAIECLDKAMHDTWEALNDVGGQLLITADHGNAECMFDDTTHQAHTAHTNEPVPFIYIGEKDWQFNAKKGSLSDIAPTILTLLDIPLPREMTGRPLLVKKHASI